MENSLKKIIIAGYPKSGNTWLTRLTADLIGCPIVGFWNEPESYEIACEGQDRVSEFQCFKAHHLYEELDLNLSNCEKKIIYVVRDPRDIAISGAHFFEFSRFTELQQKIESLPFGRAVYKRFLYRFIHPKSYCVDQMISAILQGSTQLSWCQVPWKKHYQSYLNHSVLFVKYEDMLSNPLEQCRRILDFLHHERNQDFIQAVIERQSFESKKREFVQKDEKYKVIFMRSGRSGEWKNSLSEAQKEAFSEAIAADLRFFNYDP